jgi:hypothetical protein
MPARLFDYAVQLQSVSPPVEGLAMTSDVKPSSLAEVTPGEMTWMKGRNIRPGSPASKFKTRSVFLAGAVIAGCLTWAALSAPSGAEGQPASWRPPVMMLAQNTSWFNPAITPTQSVLASPEDVAASPAEAAPAETTPLQASPLDGLKILSQSWRRGGLGSKALVTFSLRNGNDYAVKDIEIACAFLRRDGSHLTDRRRVIHDTVNMKSRKSFARLHVGFVNVNADKAKCALVAAGHI